MNTPRRPLHEGERGVPWLGPSLNVGRKALHQGILRTESDGVVHQPNEGGKCYFHPAS